ncbi:HAD family hydrolase [Paenibacillus sp. YYML68]|uniref:HAD family hydrolase n=1 Tax=Paenibacillus sp. YYML68 TaxID=2909250 RepID=UPI00249220F8|nr:HAD family hydrolase [Paenibacillus sp. YYML68]
MTRAETNHRGITIAGEFIPVKAIGFDKDGTLFHAEAFWDYVDEMRKENFVRIVGEEHGHLWNQAMGTDQPGKIDYQGVLAVATLQEEIIIIAGLIYLLKRYPWFQCRTLAESIFKEADRHMQLEKAFLRKEGVPEIFHRLTTRNIRTCIVTSDHALRTKACVDLLGIEELLDFIITPEAVTKGKPDPEMTLEACRRLQIQPHEFAVVGDSIVDMRMAKAAGSIAIGVVTHEGSREMLEKECDYLIESLVEIE